MYERNLDRKSKSSTIRSYQISVPCSKALIKTLWHQPPSGVVNKQIHSQNKLMDLNFDVAHPKRYAHASTNNTSQINGQTPKLSIKCERERNKMHSPMECYHSFNRKFGMWQWNLAIFKKYWTKSNGLVYGQPVLRIYLRVRFSTPSNKIFTFSVSVYSVFIVRASFICFDRERK